MQKFIKSNKNWPSGKCLNFVRSSLDLENFLQVQKGHLGLVLCLLVNLAFVTNLGSKFVTVLGRCGNSQQILE